MCLQNITVVQKNNLSPLFGLDHSHGDGIFKNNGPTFEQS